MYLTKFIFIWQPILMVLGINVIFSQNTNSVLNCKLQYDSLYGTNPYLYSGIKYFPEHNQARGFPFWKDDKPMIADMVFSGRYYEDLKIRYDLYNQQFILEHSDRYGGLQQIVAHRQKIDSVFIDDVLFIRNKFSDIQACFLQVIHEDIISCYFTRRKEYRFDNTGIETGHEYSDEKVTSYIVRNGKAYSFASKTGLLKIFPADKRKLIKEFIKDNRIKAKRRQPADMVKLCIYCSKLDLQ